MNLIGATMDRMNGGDHAVVAGLKAEPRLRRRLLDIGLVPGAHVDCVQVSPLGDPKAYLIRGAVIALRMCDAATVWIEKRRQ